MLGLVSGRIIRIADKDDVDNYVRLDAVDGGFRYEARGAKLNGSKLVGNVYVQPGDKITLGRTVFVFEEATVRTDSANASAAPQPERTAAAEGPATDTASASPKADSAKAEARGSVDDPGRILDAAYEQALGQFYARMDAVLTVVGELPDARAALFNPTTKTLRAFRLRDFWYEDLLQLCGEECRKLIAAPKAKPMPIPDLKGPDGQCVDQAQFEDLRRSMAVKAGAVKLGELERVGNGIWPAGTCLLLVGDTVIMLNADGTTRVIGTPVDGGCFIERDGNRKTLPVSKLLAATEPYDPKVVRCKTLAAYKLLAQWNLKCKTDAWLVLALALATMMQAVWLWRPQVWITGPTNAAKTLLMKFLLRLMGGTAKRMEGRCSEAGIRQDVGVHSEQLLIDEFDTNEPHHRVNILELLRSAGPKGVVIKGTPGHVPVRFRVVLMAWIASIEVPLERAADANRFIVLELDELKQHIEAPQAAGVEELGFELMAALLKVAPRARELEAKLGAVAMPGVQGRIVQNFAVPSAVLGALWGLNDRNAEKLLRHFVGQHATNEIVPRQSDEEQLMNAILSSQVRGRLGDTTTVGVELLRTDTGGLELESHGIRRMGPWVFLEPNAVRRHLLQGTKWANLNIRTILLRVPGAKPDQQRLAGQRPHGISIPCSVLDDGPTSQSPSPQTTRTASATAQPPQPAPPPTPRAPGSQTAQSAKSAPGSPGRP
jgi:pyruvate/2-oxoglutarate dehydrogenase complex dihydrolipoamide acyltransferase (E2) component